MGSLNSNRVAPDSTRPVLCSACQSPRMQTELSRPAARTRTDHYGPIKSGARSETERSGRSKLGSGVVSP